MFFSFTFFFKFFSNFFKFIQQQHHGFDESTAFCEGNEETVKKNTIWARSCVTTCVKGDWVSIRQ